MEDFETKKALYLKRLEENADNILALSMVDDDVKNNMTTLLVPVNEEQLEFASNYLQFIEDALYLRDNVSKINYDFKHSLIYSTIVDIVNSEKSGMINSELEKLAKKLSDNKYRGQINFDLAVIQLLSDEKKESLFKEISKDVGMNLSDGMQRFVFTSVVTNATDTMNRVLPSPFTMENKGFKDYVESFHEGVHSQDNIGLKIKYKLKNIKFKG